MRDAGAGYTQGYGETMLSAAGGHAPARLFEILIMAS
jgi:hypothetical protein